MIIIVFGLPGSGKSYFASRLAEELKAVYISSDEIRMKMISDRTYSDAEKLLVYDRMITSMSEALSQSKLVVLDATFFKASLRNKFEHAADAWREKIVYIEVTASENMIQERLNKPRNFSEADWGVYLKLKAGFEPLIEDHLVLISSDDNISSMLHDAIHLIQKLK